MKIKLLFLTIIVLGIFILPNAHYNFGQDIIKSVKPSVQVQGNQQSISSMRNSGGTYLIKQPQVEAPEKITTKEGWEGWKVRLPGNRPIATPAIYDGKVYVGGGYGSYEFYALNSKTGQIVWALHTSDDGPTAAVIYKGRVIFNTESCTLIVVDAQIGQLYWEKWLGDPLMNQPAVDDNKIYMAYPDKDGKHKLGCLDIYDGKILWAATLNTDIITAPVIANKSVYVSGMEGTVYRFDTSSGKLQWSKQKNATSAPWIYKDNIYVSVRETENVKKGNKQDRNHYEGIANLKITSGGQVNKKIWVRQKANRYLFKEDGRRIALQKKLDSSVGFASAPISGKFTSAQQNIGVIGNVMAGWAYQGSRPVVFKGLCYNTMGDVAQCLSVGTGKVKWQRTIKKEHTGRYLTPPSIVANRMYIGTVDGYIICIDIASGKEVHRITIGEPIIFQPAIVDGKLFVGTEQGSVYCIDLKNKNADGWAMWGGNPQHNGIVE